ncbi:ankyrin repeat protein [Podospora didyma]|uniref:Ankyrin repeat protein n=1 Tax=Podospora didyma TaxID=330526 RepID=A0AAE0NZ75_9PEZI|nr:ankyrin repeat protein [Podospora didyma]
MSEPLSEEHTSNFFSTFSTASRRTKVTGKEPKLRDYGLYTIVNIPEGVVECVDIIAIHGLNGHYLGTWTDEETGVNWIKDILPSTVPAARIMSFSYNSMLQFSKSTSDFFTFGQQLLESLMAERDSDDHAHRPIIFICHSLGGIVFKQAFLQADENKNYAALKNNFKGVMFFGTPHRGSGIASWATMAARLLALTSLGTSTNTQLSKDLEPSSKKLRSISDSFQQRCIRDGFDIVSCYETNKMSFLGSPVVGRESAVLGLGPNETVIAIEGDHRSMCRFSTWEEKRFQPVAARLRKMITSALKSSSNLAQSLVWSLGTVKYEAHRARNPAPVEGTCRWVLEHPKYRAWFTSPEASLLWISGDPGSGKSVLASFLVDTLTEMSKELGLNVCYFFFKSDDLQQSNATNAIKALLHQLYTQRMALAAIGASRLQGNNIDDAKRLWEVFELSTQREVTRNTICILDGLDECAVDSRRELLRSISAFLASNAPRQAELVAATGGAEFKAQAEGSRLKILVTSRPENQIKVAFEKQARSKGTSSSSYGPPAVRTAMLRLRGEDETEAIENDITKVVRFKIDDLIDRGLPAELLETVQDELIARADRTFLWVSLILNLLEDKVEAGASRRELDELLQTRDIYSIYSQLLASRSNSPRARKMLNIILAATEALTLDSISVALAVTPKHDRILGRSPDAEPLLPGILTLDQVEYDVILPFENHIKSLCGHFVRIIRNKIYLVHETAREFLLVTRDSQSISPPLRPASSSSSYQKKSEGRTASQFCAPSTASVASKNLPESFQHSFGLLEARAAMLEICVTYLYSMAKKDSSGSGSGDHPRRALAMSFLPYAATSWIVHFHQVMHKLHRQDLQYFQNLCHPLFPGFQAWIEQYWLPDLPQHPWWDSFEGIQDYYLDRFGIDLPLQVYNDNDDDDDDDEDEEECSTENEEETPLDNDADNNDSAGGYSVRGQLEIRGGSIQKPVLSPELQFHKNPSKELTMWSLRLDDAARSFGSNPSSMGNSYFPLRVDATGLVCIDFPKGDHRPTSTSRNGRLQLNTGSRKPQPWDKPVLPLDRP